MLSFTIVHVQILYASLNDESIDPEFMYRRYLHLGKKPETFIEFISHPGSMLGMPCTLTTYLNKSVTRCFILQNTGRRMIAGRTTVPTQFFKLKYIRMTEIEFFTDRFHYYIDSIEFLSNRIYGTDYQSGFNRKYQQSFTNTDFNKGELGTLFDEHPIYVEYLNELNQFSNPSENDRFEVICNYKSIAYDEMLRLQSVLIKEKNEYKMKWLQWMLLRKES